MKKLLLLGLLIILISTLFKTNLLTFKFNWFKMNQTTPIKTIIVGSGLAGLTTTLNILQSQKLNHKVILIEKCNKLGGNSIKASSGINGVPTKYQPNSKDSIDQFYNDTIKSGQGLSNSNLAHILTKESKNAINWLSQDLNIDLSQVVQLGGHSNPRTHKGSKLPPGFAIISTLIKNIQEYETKNPDRIEILKDTEMTRIIYEKGKITGIEYKQKESPTVFKLDCDNLVLATGGFAADATTSNSLLHEYRPDLLKFPSSNGIQTTGDGQKLALRDCNAKLIDMDKVQIHPTGFIKIDSPLDSWKFLCGELIRGIGGVLLNLNGERFTNELNTRDKVTDSILESCKIENEKNELHLPKDSIVSVIVISELDYPKAKNHIDFYKSQNLLIKGEYKDLYNLLKRLNPDLSISIEELTEQFHNINKVVDGDQIDKFHRKDFGSLFNKEIYFGLTTPVLHFTMGGIKTNQESNVITKDDQVIPNLYAIGEVSGGLHGANRLGGSSLLECVVFGKRVSSKILSKE